MPASDRHRKRERELRTIDISYTKEFCSKLRIYTFILSWLVPSSFFMRSPSLPVQTFLLFFPKFHERTILCLLFFFYFLFKCRVEKWIIERFTFRNACK